MAFWIIHSSMYSLKFSELHVWSPKQSDFNFQSNLIDFQIPRRDCFDEFNGISIMLDSHNKLSSNRQHAKTKTIN